MCSLSWSQTQTHSAFTPHPQMLRLQVQTTRPKPCPVFWSSHSFFSGCFFGCGGTVLYCRLSVSALLWALSHLPVWALFHPYDSDHRVHGRSFQTDKSPRSEGFLACLPACQASALRSLLLGMPWTASSVNALLLAIQPENHLLTPLLSSLYLSGFSRGFLLTGELRFLIRRDLELITFPPQVLQPSQKRLINPIIVHILTEIPHTS